jgi:hypothetical protein
MSNIIRLPRDRHHDTQLLLPWYETGQLDAADRGRVEAHLRTCSKCRADLRLEQRLEAEVAGLPLEVDQGWAAMRRRLEDGARHRGRREPRPAAGWLRRGAPAWLGWTAAASVAAFVVGWSVATQAPRPALYHTLGSAPPSAVGNVIVVFQPDAPLRAMTEALKASDARLVDGPTSAGAYVLHVAPAERQAALVLLRARQGVALAEPIDDGAAP